MPTKKTTCIPRLITLLYAIIAIALISLHLGCDSNAINKKTYPEKDVAPAITALCKKEYDIDVKVEMIGNTLWVYAPVVNMLNKENMIDEAIHKKIGNIYLNIERVVLSTDKRIDFFVLVVSDVKAGIDFVTLGHTLDMKKFMVSYISRDDFFDRLIRSATPSPLAINDTEGRHINRFDIKLSDFVTNQLLDRLRQKFSDTSKYDISYLNALYEDGILKIAYNIKPKGAGDIKENVDREILDIAALVFKNYEFKEFLALELDNMATHSNSVHTYIELRKLS